MQHKIGSSQHGPRGSVMADAVQSCVHCGFCLAACPTYKLLGQEMDSPRGRIVLMKGVLEGEIAAEEAQPHIDRCLGCVGCMPACPSGVPYGALLMSYRAKVEGERKRPFLDKITRTLITETLPYPTRFRRAVQTGKLARAIQSGLPEQLDSMIDLLPDKAPNSAPLPKHYPAQGKRRARVALLAGCVQQVLAPEINWATLRVLAANGVETIIPPNQSCCGSILMHIGEDQHAHKLARHNLNTFPQDVDAIITNAAGCGSGMKEYGVLFAGDAIETQASNFAKKVQDVAEFLDELGLSQPAGMTEQMRIAYHDACHLRHAQGVMAAPRRLLRTIPNVELVEVGDNGLCCGSAGTYNLEQPDLANALGQQKAQAILATGADAVATGNIGCLTQIQMHLAKLGRELPLYHTVQILDKAYQ